MPDVDQVLGQWAGFGLLQLFTVQMERINIIHLELPENGAGAVCQSVCPATTVT